MGIASYDFEFKSNLWVRKGAPLDSRSVVDTISDLTDSDVWSESYPYNGMFVVVKNTGDGYILLDKNNITDINSWKKLNNNTWSILE